jgi:hypothetical protein
MDKLDKWLDISVLALVILAVILAICDIAIVIVALTQLF